MKRPWRFHRQLVVVNVYVVSAAPYRIIHIAPYANLQAQAEYTFVSSCTERQQILSLPSPWCLLNFAKLEYKSTGSIPTWKYFLSVPQGAGEKSIAIEN
jgi:hypothetical protein